MGSVGNFVTFGGDRRLTPVGEPFFDIPNNQPDVLDYYHGVWSVHYWYNISSRSIERRRQWTAATCNMTPFYDFTIGWDNWVDDQGI